MLGVGICAVPSVLGACSAMAARIDVPVTDWQFSAKGNYVGRPDRRELYQVIHPWTTSRADDFGLVQARVIVPTNANPPYTLCFYVTDSNYGEGNEAGMSENWVNNDVRVGHRFRQALVDGEVVWSEDTYRNEQPQHYLVDITGKVEPSKPFALAFRLWDAVDSDATLPGDIYVTDYYAQNVATAARVSRHDWSETRSYWGDVAVYTGEPPKAEAIPWGWPTVLKRALGYPEPRRGAYIGNHGSASHMGATPSMDGILCSRLRKYHLRTDDPRVAKAIIRTGESLFAEAHDPLHTKTAPNIDYYYSHNPYLRGVDGFTPTAWLNLNIAAAQAYGAYLAADPGFADIARRTWAAGLAGESVYPEVAYDLSGVVYWMDKAGMGAVPQTAERFVVLARHGVSSGAVDAGTEGL